MLRPVAVLMAIVAGAVPDRAVAGPAIAAAPAQEAPAAGAAEPPAAVPRATGFAHLFEHVMFQGTKHVGEDKHFEYLQKAGASNVNGSTSQDRTNYFEVVPANQV